MVDLAVDCEDIRVEMVRLWPGLSVALRDLVKFSRDSKVVTVEQVAIDVISEFARKREVREVHVSSGGRDDV